MQHDSDPKDPVPQSLPLAVTAVAKHPWLPLALLGSALACGAVSVWQLRQAWAKELGWPWALLVGAMFVAAYALHQLDPWLPGAPIRPRLRAVPLRTYRIGGVVCLVCALGLAGWVVGQLWPDYHVWQGTPLPWLAALGLFGVGAGLVGTVGQAAPRAALARSLWPATRRNRWLEMAAFVLILGLAIFLRTYRLDQIPAGIYVDETNGGLDALYLLEGRPDSPFATGWYETPNGFLYYMAAIFKLFGATWMSLKAVSLIPAILTVPAVYLLGRLLFGPSAGLVAMWLLAVSRWHLSMSRWGWSQTAPPLFQVLALFFLIRGLRDRRASDYALGGLLTGLSFYTYLSSRLAAATLVLYLLYWLWSDPAGWRSAVRACWLGLLIFAAGVVMAAAPLAVTYISNPFAFMNRSTEISVFRDVRDQDSFEPFVQNIGDILKFFHQRGDMQGKHNLPGEPMADPVTGLLFALGLAYALLAWRDQRRILLLLWLLLGLAGSFLSSHHESPQAYRSMTALPAVALLAADVFDRMLGALYRLLGARPRLAGLTVAACAICALTGAGLWEARIYFGAQAQSIEVLRGFNPLENRIAHETIAALQAEKTVYMSPVFSDYSPLRFLVYGVIKAQTGENTLIQRPYQVIVPGVKPPLPATGHDALLLLDRSYWPLRDYLTTFYPHARLDLVRWAVDEPLYLRAEIGREDIDALQGLTAHLTFADGRREARRVADVALRADEVPPGTQVEWVGSLRLDQGGEYTLHGEGGLQVLIDGQPWAGQHYLGRGLYGLRVVRPGTASGAATLSWQTPDRALAPIPPAQFFRISQAQGLLGTYYRGPNWEGAPLFRQMAPVMLLDWRDEQPLGPETAFSARFTGALRVTEPGSYRFWIDADDGARLTLDEQVLGEGLIPGQPNLIEATITLAVGDHPLHLDYFQQAGGAALRLFWSRDNEPLTPVPPAALVPPPPG